VDLAPGGMGGLISQGSHLPGLPRPAVASPLKQSPPTAIRTLPGADPAAHGIGGSPPKGADPLAG
jgi:hypothetical protein